MKLLVGKAPSESLALTNCVIVNPKDFVESVKHVLVKQQYATSIKYVPLLHPPSSSILLPKSAIAASYLLYPLMA